MAAEPGVVNRLRHGVDDVRAVLGPLTAGDGADGTGEDEAAVGRGPVRLDTPGQLGPGVGHALSDEDENAAGEPVIADEDVAQHRVRRIEDVGREDEAVPPLQREHPTLGRGLRLAVVP